MKRFFAIIFLVIPLVVFSTNITELFQSAQASNSIFILAQLNLKMANMKYERNAIQASSKGDELSVELYHTSDLISYNNKMKNYYVQINNSIFGVLTSKIDVEVGKLNLQSATIDYGNTLLLFKNSLVSQNDLEEASLTVIDMKNKLENSKWNYDDSMKSFKQSTGKDWEDLTVGIPKYSSIPASYDVWKKKDLSLKSASFNLQIAKYNSQNMPSNSSQYAKESAQINVSQAEIDYKETQISSERNFLSSLQQLKFIYTSLLNSKKNVEILAENLKDAKQRYNQGLVSQKTYINQRVQYLNAQKGYYQSLNGYLNSLCTYLISMGFKPEEVLK